MPRTRAGDQGASGGAAAGRHGGPLVLLCVLCLLAGCASMQANEHLVSTGAHHPGTFYRVTAADFPSGRIEGTPTSEGSRLLVDAALVFPSIADFVAAHGIPRGIAVRYEPNRLRKVTVMLGYLETTTAYVFQNSPDDPVHHRPLVGSELPELDPDAELAQQILQLERWLPAQARLARVSRRVLMALPPAASGTGVADYGIVALRTDRATALRFGHPPEIAARVVAWVDPMGPNHGRLEPGDLILSSGRSCARIGSMSWRFDIIPGLGRVGGRVPDRPMTLLARGARH